MNVAVRDGGCATVEVLDANSKPLPGLALRDCVPLTADGIKQVVSWKSGAGLSQLANRPLRLRVALKDAELYSFQFTTEE